MAFTREKQDTHWKYVASEDEPESPCPMVKSVVAKLNNPGRKPRPRKERDLLPVSLGELEPISLEEQPTKVRGVETVCSASLLLEDLACSTLLSSSSSSSDYKESETVNDRTGD